jgi:Putative lactococcus lactis phage r1t holin
MSVHSLFSRTFWIATLERAIRSFAASLASLLTAGGAGILDTDWGEKLSVAAMATVVTVLLAIGGGTFGKGDGPSFVGEEDLAGGKPARVPPASPVAAAPAVPAQPAAPAVEQLPAVAPAPAPVV